MKKQINSNNIYISLGVIFFFIVGCIAKQTSSNFSNVKCELNDSLSVTLFFKENKNISSIIIENNNNNTSSFISFYKDGTTPVIIGHEKDGLRAGLYYTYYSSGRLSSKSQYLQGEIHGESICFSEDGRTIFKARYDKGIEQEVIVKDSTLFDIEISPARRSQ